MCRNKILSGVSSGESLATRTVHIDEHHAEATAGEMHAARRLLHSPVHLTWELQRVLLRHLFHILQDDLPAQGVPDHSIRCTSLFRPGAAMFDSAWGSRRR